MVNIRKRQTPTNKNRVSAVGAPPMANCRPILVSAAHEPVLTLPEPRKDLYENSSTRENLPPLPKRVSERQCSGSKKIKEVYHIWSESRRRHRIFRTKEDHLHGKL